MRLIDADALIEDFKSRLPECNDWIENAKDKETKIRADTIKTFIAEVILTIKNAPTVERPIRGLAKVDKNGDIKIELLKLQPLPEPYKKSAKMKNGGTV